MRTRRVLGVAATTALVAQVVPAGSWLPRVRRVLAPALASPMHRGEVALTFDDGPDAAGTPAVLDALDRLGWPATFFVLGSAAAARPDVVREVARRGHQVAVHGFEHRYLLGRTPAAAYDDLRRARDVVAEVTGTLPQWWRPPYGVLTGPALLAARRLGVRPLLWSAWGREWQAEADAASVAATVCAGRLDGGTILLHDSDVTSAPGTWRRTSGALPLIAAELERRRLRVAPLPQG